MDRPLDGYGTTGQPDGRLLEWPYTGKNGLYYGRDAVALSDAEKSLRVQVCNLESVISLYKGCIRTLRYCGEPASSLGPHIRPGMPRETFVVLGFGMIGVHW